MRSCAILLMLVLSAPGVALEVVQGEQVLECRLSGQTVLRYRFAGVPFKPYADILTTPSGINLLLDAPADHLHHHGLMFAVRLNDVNFWEESATPGKQISTGLNPTARGFVEHLRWESPAGGELAREERSVVVHEVPGQEVTLITWRTSLSASGIMEATLTGAHYHGLGVRFIRDMDVTGEVVTPSDDPGEVVRGSEKLRKGAWCAYRATAAGKPVTVALFDDPDNARAATWFNMSEPFAYMSATLNSHREPLEFRSLDLKYGVAAWDGHVSKEDIEALYQQWMALKNAGGK